MSKFFSRPVRSSSRGSLPSALYLLEWAGLLIVLFIIAHAAGLRDFTSVLNGTVGSTNMDWNTAALLGVAYVLVYLGVVIVVPILVLAAFILRIWRKILATKGATNESRANAQEN